MQQTRRILAPLWLVGLIVALIAITGMTASAQTPFFPYFGKNRVKYDDLKWHIYTTDHFEIYYYPESEPHLERLAGYAESAYQQISSELKHDLAIKIPLVLYKTHSEFEQTNIYPSEIPEGVAAFAEPQRNRMVLPLDEPPDRLYGLIVHELTHIFEFDIIPRSLIRSTVPLWVDEGLADYMRGAWTPLDLMTVRDAAVADIIPEMSKLEAYGGFTNPRLIYNLGHTAFEFIESKWGKEGIRQFMFALRKNVIGGSEDAYEEAFRVSPQEFDEQFNNYLKERFKPFRDKELPSDYGRNLAPDPLETNFSVVLSIEPSPSGDLLAAVAINRKDSELDIVLISATDGEVIRNLTTGFNKDYGWEYIVTPGARFNTVPWMSWSPVGDRIAYFVRTEKQKSLILQNVLSRRVEKRVELVDVDEPESPDISPDGTKVAFAALEGAVGDIFIVDLATDEVVNVTKDEFADYSPTFSPDGKTIVYLVRVSGNNKLFELDIATGEKTQLTFGTHDDASAQFLDAETLVFSSTAIDPTQPVPPEVAANGNVYNVWTLSLTTGELRQYTDALGGNSSVVVLSDGPPQQLAFVTYSKGEYGLHLIEREEALYTANTSDFGAPAAIIDFQVPLSHTLIAGNTRRKGKFEKLFLEGRPPVNIGVSSGGDLFGGTQVVFTDVLGDQQFNLSASSVSQYRSFGFSYINLAGRFQYALQGFSQTQFFFGLQPGQLFNPGLGFLSRNQAVATRTVQGGTAFGIYPLNRYARLEFFGGVNYYDEQFNDPGLQAASDEFQAEQGRQGVLRTGLFVPLGVTFVQETTVFREFGPLAGNTMRVSFEVAPKISNSLSRQTFEIDARRYLRLGGTGLLALRFRGFNSWGDAPDFIFYGGNSELRGYEYLEFLGHQVFFADAELRFPLIEAMLTPLGVLGGVRGVFFFNIGGASFIDSPFVLWDRSDEVYVPTTGFRQDPLTGQVEPIDGTPALISGFRLRDSRASYGFGLTTFAIGFPVHLDWSWRTLFNRGWEDALFATNGGSTEFRRPRFAIWIGYDF